MTTATQPTLTDPMGRKACLHGHHWTPESRRIDWVGVWHCKTCLQLAQRRSEERRKAGGPRLQRQERDIPAPKAEAAPVEVRWHVYRLNEMERGLPTAYILRLLQWWFVRKMQHSPEVIRVAASRAKAFTAASRANPRWTPTILGDASIEDDGWIGMR
ncbi:MAG: hypothetical protein Q7O66_07500 [Dehalococcoidia bacterium]|nr:hypothetical protein [Dehalococcoidia bacterium]